MKNFLKRFLHYPVSLLILCAILYLSLFKPAGNDTLKLFAGMDKVAHFMMYAVLSSAMWFEHYWFYARIRYARILMMSFVIPVLFSGVMEIMQMELTTYRSADILDFLFNVTGVVFANLICFFVLRPVIDRKLKRKETL